MLGSDPALYERAVQLADLRGLQRDDIERQPLFHDYPAQEELHGLRHRETYPPQHLFAGLLHDWYDPDLDRRIFGNEAHAESIRQRVQTCELSRS